MNEELGKGGNRDQPMTPKPDLNSSPMRSKNLFRDLQIGSEQSILSAHIMGAALEKLLDSHQEELNRIVESEQKRITDEIQNQRVKAQKALLFSLEDEGTWKRALDEVEELGRIIAKLRYEKGLKISQTKNLTQQANLAERQRVLEISEELNGEGKKKYPNDSSRSAALEIWKSQDPGYLEIQRQSVELDLEVLQLNLKLNEAETKLRSSMKYVDMIEARLRAFAATR